MELVEASSSSSWVGEDASCLCAAMGFLSSCGGVCISSYSGAPWSSSDWVSSDSSWGGERSMTVLSCGWGPSELVEATGSFVLSAVEVESSKLPEEFPFSTGSVWVFLFLFSTIPSVTRSLFMQASTISSSSGVMLPSTCSQMYSHIGRPLLFR